MAITAFPPVERADEHGVLAQGGDLSVPSLLLAYRSGVFPWPVENVPLLWWAVPQRAVLFTKDLLISRSLAKELKRARFTIRFNNDFPAVIQQCARMARPKQRGTWITPQMISAYIDFFNAGYCYCVEAYLDQRLVGGLYGVLIGTFISAESMFHLETDASKICLHALIQHLRSQGVAWVDLQVLNPFTLKIGAQEVPRDTFMNMLQEVVDQKRIVLSKKNLSS